MDSKKKIAILSNIMVDLIKQKLRKRYDVYVPEGFDTWVSEVLNPASKIYSYDIEAIIVLIDGTEARNWVNIEEARNKIELWKQAVGVLRNNIQEIPIFISTIDIQENRIKAFAERKYKIELENEWYQYIQQLVETSKNVYCFDLADKISDIGRKQFYSNKMWYMSNMPYSREGLLKIVDELENIFNSIFSPRKKIIALDLDNTLWGGVIGEDGVEKIELSNHKEGQRFYDFQYQLKQMKNRGLLLSLISKNNESDVEKAMVEHPFMLLKNYDFVSKRINWENKAINLKSESQELNLTEKSFIFIDDNPIEREIVSGECPEALVPEFPDDTTELIDFAENLYFRYIRPLRILDEDLKKTQMYQIESQRKQEMGNSISLEDYIKKLEIYVDIHRMKFEEIERVSQLCNKSNQFNVTTKRYTVQQIVKMSTDDKYAIYTVSSKDKYGENGLISVVILHFNDEVVEIDTFLMSCRVMGRMLENVIINEIGKCYKNRYNIVRAKYVATEKNIPVADLFERLGFNKISENDKEKSYEIMLEKYNSKPIDYYKQITFVE